MSSCLISVVFCKSVALISSRRQNWFHLVLSDFISSPLTSSHLGLMWSHHCLLSKVHVSWLYVYPTSHEVIIELSYEQFQPISQVITEGHLVSFHLRMTNFVSSYLTTPLHIWTHLILYYFMSHPGLLQEKWSVKYIFFSFNQFRAYHILTSAMRASHLSLHDCTRLKELQLPSVIGYGL